MGSRIAALILQDKQFFLAGGIEDKNHPQIGKDLGQYLNGERLGLPITSDCPSVLEQADVLIEFTSPQATISHLSDCLSLKKAMVIGTTGLGEKDERKIRMASKKIAIVRSSNMSLGINLLFGMLRDIVKKIGSYYDIEIIEAHHNKKKDAPSGTALTMAKIICSSLGLDFKKVVRFGRQGKTGPRSKREIGIHAIRGGEIVGDHSVLFAGDGECIELIHRAQSRDAFAQGALLATQFIYNKKKGLYDMQDVLRRKS
jgi:4-hydroxy-tetrahydrodipicolinate reductase